MNLSNIVCPVSTEKIDSNASRLTVFLKVLLMGTFVFTLHIAFVTIVAVDYCIRAFFKPKYSPLRALALGIAAFIGIQKKPIGMAQKVFASRLGFICALTALLLLVSHLDTASIIVAGLLMGLSIMDSIFNFCVGCLIYNYIVYPFYAMDR